MQSNLDPGRPGQDESMAPLRAFVQEMTRLVGTTSEESELIDSARPLLARLVSKDDWLPQACARSDPQFYQSHLLHCDPLERFSLVSFVWGPGQQTSVHDHGVWGLIGMLRGAERDQHYRVGDDGGLQPDGAERRLEPGAVEVVSPLLGDIHRVANAYADRVSISIHLYGGNIGSLVRHEFDPVSGTAKPFVSGYSTSPVPNLWDRSAVIRRGLAAA